MVVALTMGLEVRRSRGSHASSARTRCSGSKTGFKPAIRQRKGRVNNLKGRNHLNIQERLGYLFGITIYLWVRYSVSVESEIGRIANASCYCKLKIIGPISAVVMI